MSEERTMNSKQASARDDRARTLVLQEVQPALLGLIEMENYLSDLLGVKVDLVVRESLKPHIGKRVLREVVPV